MTPGPYDAFAEAMAANLDEYRLIKAREQRDGDAACAAVRQLLLRLRQAKRALKRAKANGTETFACRENRNFIRRALRKWGRA